MKKMYIEPQTETVLETAHLMIVGEGSNNIPLFPAEPGKPTRSAVMPIPANGSGMPQLL